MAFCGRCAAPNVDSAVTCAACGAPLQASAAPDAQAGAPTGAPPPAYYAGYAPAGRMNGLAIAGFVCAFLCWPAGIIMSIIAYNQCKANPEELRGQGFALAGIIISAIGAVLGIIQIAAICSQASSHSYGGY